jgi:hypothetical protein
MSSEELEATVLKPIPIHAEKGRRELAFYQQLEEIRQRLKDSEALPAEWTGVCSCNTVDGARKASRSLDDVRSWLSFFPRFHGTLTLPIGTAAVLNSDTAAAVAAPQASVYLHLEDVTHPYAHPSLLDCKIGVHSWDPFDVAAASESDRAKVAREDAKCASQAQTGFRICGARIWQPISSVTSSDPKVEEASSCGSYVTLDKHWGRGILEHQIEQPFWVFFGHPSSAALTHPDAKFIPSPAAVRIGSAVLPQYLERLRTLLHLCTCAPLWRFYASSLLFSYQLVPTALGASAAVVASSEPPVTAHADVHLIDFGHVYSIRKAVPDGFAERTSADASKPSCESCGLPDPTLDENYMHGLRYLIALFQRMLQRCQKVAQ